MINITITYYHDYAEYLSLIIIIVAISTNIRIITITMIVIIPSTMIILPVL